MCTMSRKTKLKWYALGQRRCHCGVQLVYNRGASNEATTEHLVPRSHGGKNYQENLMVMCAKCNTARGNSSFITWVLKNDYPKKDWLIERYCSAVRKHINQGHNIGICVRDKNIAVGRPAGINSLADLKKNWSAKHKRIMDSNS